MHICNAIALLPITYSAITDCKHRKIPDISVLLVSLCAVVKTLLLGNSLRDLLLGGLGISAFIIITAVLGHCDIGGGDVKLSSALGCLYGFEDAMGMVVVSMFLMIMYGAARKEKALPFAPFVLLSTAAFEFYQLIHIKEC